MMPRRIAYVLKIFPKLSETFIANELAELRRRQIDVRILSLLPPRDTLRHEFIRSAGLDELTSYEPAEFGRVLAEFRPQLLHAHFATESTAKARALAAEHALPFTFTCHGYDIYRKAPADFRERAQAAQAVITVSHANATYLEQAFGVERSKTRVIPSGVNTVHFCPSQRGLSYAIRSFGQIPPPLPLIGCVARLVTVKNLALLIQACAMLRARGLSFRCIIAGEGPCRPELERLRAQLGLEGCVEMPGPVEQADVLKLWQRASVGVLTSMSEGMPVCLMEAAACGVPVVATAVGGVPELLQDGVTGLLTPTGNAQALASALERLLGDPELRAVMSSAARERAESYFSVERQVDQLLALWSEILEQDRTRAARRQTPSGRRELAPLCAATAGVELMSKPDGENPRQ